MSVAATESATSMEKSGVEELRERIAGLIVQRQELRLSGASSTALEQNRLQLGRSQWELCHALIKRHVPRLVRC
jgi:hypothetical protein